MKEQIACQPPFPLPCAPRVGRIGSMRRGFHVMTENLETYFLKVIFGLRRGYRAGVVRSLLYLLSKVFQVTVKFRRFLYNLRRRWHNKFNA
jgi:hypothetical protein